MPASFEKLANEIFSPVDAGGSPRRVSNSDAQIWGSTVERLLSATSAAGTWYATRALMNADLAHDAGTLGIVYADPNPAFNGMYVKQGASGSGSWAQISNQLPTGAAVVAVTVTGGGPNAITASFNPNTQFSPGQAIYILRGIVADNTGPVTINGKPLLTNGGEQIAAGEILPGDLLVFLDNGAHFRLIMDTGSLRNKLAAEAAQAAAEDARDIAAGYASSAVSQGNVPIYATVAGMSALEVPAGINAVRVNGRMSAGDGEGGLYVDEDNGSADKFMSGGATARAWYRASDLNAARLPAENGKQAAMLEKLVRERKIGLVAGPGRVCNARNTTFQQMMSRTKHFAYEDISSIQMVFANWFIDAASHPYPEAGSGADLVLHAAVEYPVGVFSELNFSGSATGVIPSGANLLNDPEPVAIPKGAEFWVRTYATCTAGVPCAYNVSGDQQSTNTNAHQSRFAESGVVDVVMGGAITSMSNSTGLAYGPVAIIGETNQPSFIIYGDSIALGAGDVADSTVHMGAVARGIGSEYPYILAACGGDRLGNLLLSNTRRIALADYCTHAVNQYGSNDIMSEQISHMTMLSRMDEFAKLLPDHSIYATTIVPRSTSTDSWTTTANQTPVASGAQRVYFNNAVRDGVPGYVGYFEIADALETTRNSGIWKVTGAAFGYTYDGIHPSAAGYQLILGAAYTLRRKSLALPNVRFATDSEARNGLLGDRAVTPRGVSQATGLGQNGIGRISFGPSIRTPDRLVVNIVSGTINIGDVVRGDRSYIAIDTEGGASTDELHTIIGGDIGDIILIKTTTSTRDVTVQHLVGNIRMIGGVDFTLDTALDHLEIMKIATDMWIERIRMNIV